MNLSGPQAPYIGAAVAGAIAYFSTATDEFQTTTTSAWIIGIFVVIGFVTGWLLRRRDLNRDRLINDE